MSSKKKKNDDQGALIYCGPNLPGGLLNRHTVYQNGLPGHLEAHFESCPALRRLFVPVHTMNATDAAIMQSGTSYNVWNKEVLEHFAGGGKR